jgi:hypothetical protein
MNPNSHGQHYSKRLECLLHSPSWIEKEIIKTPAYPARLVTSSRPPLHRLRRVSITCATDLRLTLLFSYHSCFYCNRKTNFWAWPLCAFWIKRTRRVEKLLGSALLFLFLFLLSLMIAGVLEVSWVFCFWDALLSEQGMGRDGQIGGANGIGLVYMRLPIGRF